MFNPTDSFKNFTLSLYLFKKQRELKRLSISYEDWEEFYKVMQKELSSLAESFLRNNPNKKEETKDNCKIMQDKEETEENLDKEEEGMKEMPNDKDSLDMPGEFSHYSVVRRFRGVDTTNHKYVYGKLIPSLGKGDISVILGTCEGEVSSYPRYHEVYPLSLCASTEYLDRNGNEIFENDSLSYIEPDSKKENILGKVIWDYEKQGWYIPLVRTVSELYEDIVCNRSIVSKEPKIDLNSYGEDLEDEDLEEVDEEDAITEKSSRVRGFEFISLSPENAKLPCRQTKYSAGYDFYLCYDVEILPGETVMIPTWVKAYMPENEYLSIFIRSSLGVEKRLCLANGTGIVDSDYYNNKSNEGHIMLAIHNYGSNPVTLKQGSRVAQGIFQKYYLADNDEAEEERLGGFGSTND